MWRALMVGVFAVTLAHGVRAEEDPRDAERQFRFLLSRGDANALRSIKTPRLREPSRREGSTGAGVMDP